MTKQVIYNAKTGETTTVDLTTEEVNSRKSTSAEDLANFRRLRDLKLSETDWWAVSDRTMSDAQKKYRQDLRDLPANTADPKSPTWPSKP